MRQRSTWWNRLRKASGPPDPRRMPVRSRRLCLEPLENRRLLAVATDLASIRGRVFDDFSGDGFTAGEQVANVSLDLFRGNNDGNFTPGSGDVELRMTLTDENGNYEFSRLTAGEYFVVQRAQTASGRTLQRSVSPPILVTEADAAGRLITTIDSFDGSRQSVRDETNDGVAVTDQAATSEAIGGFRDLLVDLTSTAGAIETIVNNNTSPSQLSIGSDGVGDGRRLVIWDGGGDDPLVVNDSGLANIDLTSAGQSLGIRVTIGADLTGGNVVIRLYTDDGVATTAGRFSATTLSIPALNDRPTSVEFIPFTAFTTTSGGGADLTRIGAIELEVLGRPNYDALADLIGAIGPTLKTQDFDNFETADLSLTKVLTSTAVNLNGPVTFAITVSNAGVGTATNIVIADTLPAGITYVSNTVTTGSFAPLSSRWTIPSLAPNTSATLTLTGTLTSLDPQVNTAEIISVDQFDPNSTPNNNVETEDDQASAPVVATRIDLRLTQSVSNSRPNVGETITLTISVDNAGPNSATGIAVQNTLPAGLTLVSNTPSAGSFNVSTGRWTIPSLGVATPGNPAVGTATLTLQARANASGSLTNLAEIVAADQSDVDSTPGNNVTTEDDQAAVTITTPVADLSLTKTITSSGASVGSNATFVITLNNDGPDPATGVVVRDVLPAGLSYVADVTSIGDYDPATGLWTVGNVPVISVGSGGTPHTLTLTARVDSIGDKTNTATVTAADQSDPDSTPGSGPATEDDTAAITLTPVTIDLELSKTIAPPRPTPSDTITTTLTLRNVGGATATGVRVADLLPAGLVFQSAETLFGNYSGATGIWDVGNVGIAGDAGPATLTILATLDPNRTSPLAAITNTAQVSAADQFDIDSSPGNSVATEDDQSSATITPARADLSLTKTVSPINPNVGDEVTFTVTLRNDGPDASGNVVVADSLPSGATLVRENASIGDYDEATGRWTIANLPANQSATLAIVVRTLSPDVVNNVAEIIVAAIPDPDSTPGNNVTGEDDRATASVTSRQIDLSLTKTVDDETPKLGDSVTFTVTLANAGPSEATGVVVADRLPTGLTLLTATPDRGSFNTTTRQWTVGSLASGATTRLIVRARVDNAILNQDRAAANVAEVIAANETDLDSTVNNNLPTEDDQATATVRVAVADLSLEKRVDNTTPNVGEVIAFEIIASNAGPNPATGVIISDTLPPGATFQSNSLTNGQFDPATGQWRIDSIGVNQSETLTIFAVVGQAAAGGGPRTNVAEVTAADQDDSDSTPGNNVPTEDDRANADIRVPVIDLSLRKSVTPARPSVGGQARFTLTITNAGPDSATGVVVADQLPAGLTFVSASPSAQYNAGTGRWNVDTLASGATASLDITATVNAIDVISNAAEVIAADQFDTDSTPGSGTTDGQDDTASVSLTPASADLSLEKTVSDATPNRDESVTFTLTLRNAGPDAAADIVVLDRLPTGLTLAGNTPQTGTYDSATGRWTIPALAAGQFTTLSLTADVGGETAITNTAEVIASSQRDPNSTPGNNVATEDDQASVVVTPQLVDLSLTKTIDNARPNLSETIAYTIRLANAGPSDATNIRIADSLPAGLTFVSSSTEGSAGPGSGGGYNSQTGVWTVTRLTSGATASLTLRARVSESVPADALANGILNVVEIVTVDQPDRDSTPGNNVAAEDDQASVRLTLPRADLSIEKIADRTDPDRNQVIAFLITVRNDGPDAATNIVIRDALPAGLQLDDAFTTTGQFDRLTSLWTIGSLANGAAATLQLTATVVGSGATSDGVLTNTAEIAQVDQLDPDSTPGNNLSTEDDRASVAVRPRVADVSVTGTVDNEAPLVDEVVTITITAMNAAGADLVDANGVILSASVPEGLTLLTAVPERGSYDAATGRWTLGPLAVGASVDLTLTARVDQRGTRRLIAEVIAMNQFDRDSVPGNNIPTEDDQAEIIIRAPRLLTKRLFLSV